jgi:pimeloyl-ACP methyl ester carboxylesterase
MARRRSKSERHGWSAGTIRHHHPATNRVAFLIGGLAKTGYDWRPLIPHLRKKANVFAVPLARHTGRMWDLRRCRPWNMWKEAERKFLELSAQAGGPIVVGGFSTGALIAYFLYKQYPEKVSALILAGCPTWLVHLRHFSETTSCRFSRSAFLRHSFSSLSVLFAGRRG